ncbi:hypothetical protein ARMGADRAFT_855330, partial [Armillaria gallica]
INSIKTDTLKVIIDSGSDITLISESALNSLSKTPRVHEGQKINLVQVTGSASISGYVKLDLYFDTEEGPVKINVDAYVVKGMTTPLILGNDFADQYSLSIVHRAGDSFLSFGDTGRELKVSSSLSPTMIDATGQTFQVKVSQDTVSNLPRNKAHCKAQKQRRRVCLARQNGEVHAHVRAVIPPESCLRVPIEVFAPVPGKEWFIEK